MSTSSFSIERPLRPDNPETLWREICWVSDQLAVSGDLSSRKEHALTQLSAWEEAGITDVFDMRGEADDSEFIHSNSTITSHWFGVDDNGGTRSDAWFDALTAQALVVLTDPTRRALVHCHMGVNRGPSALYAILLHLGWNHVDALRHIRDARPIAGIIYAADAASWKARRDGLDSETVQSRVDDVQSWFGRNPLDIAYVIRRIGSQFAR
jgi:dual specificity phosphatase 3